MDDGEKISVRFPVRHYRVPSYVRGKRGSVEAVIVPPDRSFTTTASPFRRPGCERVMRDQPMAGCASRSSRPGCKGFEMNPRWDLRTYPEAKTLWGDSGKGGGGLSDDIGREWDIAEFTAKELSFVQAPSE